MSYSEALKSSVPEEIRVTRASVKGSITRTVKRLEAILVRTVDSRKLFDHEAINKIEAKDLYDKLQKSIVIFQDLHDRYCELRSKEADQNEEMKVVQAEEVYVNEVLDKVYSLYDTYDKYNRSSIRFEKIKMDIDSIPEREKQLNASREEFKNAKEAAGKIVADEEEELKPAEYVKSALTKAFTNLVAGAKLVRGGYEAREDEETSYEAKVDYSKEQREMSELLIKLERIILTQKVNEEKEKSIGFHAMAGAGVLSSTRIDSSSGSSVIKMNKVECPKFSGFPRDFAQFKKEFESIVAVPGRQDNEVGVQLRNAIPRKFVHLINNFELADYKSMMEVLTVEFGASYLVVDDVVAQIERIKLVINDKTFIDFVEKLEKIQRDLSALSLVEEIANSAMIGKLEAKLPHLVYRDWSKEVIDSDLNKKSSKIKFGNLMEFLIKTKKQVKYLGAESRQNVNNAAKSQTNTCFVTGTTFVTDSKPSLLTRSVQEKSGFLKPCLICSSDGATNLESTLHPMNTCAVWKALPIDKKLSKVKCKKHPFATNHTTSTCKKKIWPCNACKEDTHNSLLCPKKVSTHTASSITKAALGTLAAASMPPVMVLTQYVKGAEGQSYGTMLDHCSTDHYITLDIAEKYKFPGEAVELLVEGIRGETSKLETKLYKVPIRDRHGVVHVLDCYGLPVIASAADSPEEKPYKDLCFKFGIKSSQVRRPRQIDLLISMRAALLLPQAVKNVGNMVLFDGPLGQVLGGFDPDLVYVEQRAMVSAVHHVLPTAHTATLRALVKEVAFTNLARTDRELLDYFKEENIGAECNPKCGGCLCGKCPLGAKKMSLKDEREYEIFSSKLSYDVKGTREDPGPYWRASYPWLLPKEDLIDNKPAVLGVMNATARKLSKDPSWRDIYETQLKDLVARGFAREISEEEISIWKKNGGKIYYMAHQMALNPGSKSTPVRTVFNNSQMFKGFSLNSSWALGPDIMNSLHGVLLRFREDLVGAQGDISKMYYMIRVTVEEQMMQLFVWKFDGEEKIRTFSMTRLVMGNKPSANLSIIAVRKTAELENFSEQYPIAFKALVEDSYVDNVFITAPDIDKLSFGIEEIEFVGKKGGFRFKEWIVSGQKVPQQVIGIQLPGAVTPDEEKALGVHWDVEKDELFIDPDLTSGGKKGSVKTPAHVHKDGPFDEENPSFGLPPTLTLRICLSLHARAFDPLGLVLPTRMIGNLLFRNNLQFLKRDNCENDKKKKDKKSLIPWDEEVGSQFRIQWMQYFQLLRKLKNVMFPRSIKPKNVDPDIKPDLVTFCDGNPDVYGGVAYALWTLQDTSKKATLIVAKAKLGPLTHKGETVKNELSGATLVSRLRTWIIENTGLAFDRHIPFLDSRIVQDMILKESYGYNTFAGLRVAEIQMKTDVTSWYHIPSKENIADILTKGSVPDCLEQGSIWQSGPAWLTKDEKLWPITRPKLSEEQLETVLRFQKGSTKIKCLVSIVTKFGDSSEMDGLVARCGSLSKLIRATAYILRLVGRTPKHKCDLVGKVVTREVSAGEYNDAWNYLICWDQEVRLDRKKSISLCPVAKSVKLSRIMLELSQVVLSGRIKNFPVSFSHNQDIPIVPDSAFGKLIVRYYHDKYHKDIDTTVALVRHDVWVIKARKFATQIDKRCRICLEKRKIMASQVMGDLPSFRYEPSPAFTAVCMDLFGPVTIRDDCIKKGPRIYKKVWGVIYACAATRAVYLDVSIDYSTEAVLHTVRRLLAHKGDVRMIVSDPGSQLVGASKELLSWRKGWDMELLTRFGAKKSVEWRTIMPDSQHQNGAAESLVKMVKGVKKSLLKTMGDTKLSLNELNTLLAECSNLVNERPIGIKPNSQTDSEYLSPNSLLLGRCSARISSGPFQCEDVYDERPGAAKTRFLLVQRIIDQFWNVWTKLYFPSLIIQQKWHTQKRNLSIGDICLLQDSNTMRAEWRMCKVMETYPDIHGVVRNVEVKVAPVQDGGVSYKYHKPNCLKRHVSKLIVIVPVEEKKSHSEDNAIGGVDNVVENQSQ